MRNDAYTYVIEFDFSPTDPAFDSFEALIDELNENIRSLGPESTVDGLVANIPSEKIIISLRDASNGRMTTVWPGPNAWRR